ncbi:putative diguanylate cyclase/response regulator [Hyphomonas neptunium ATCC 15444]|uniref:diguanylate cyclase n=2 Tax=Hyphomonas TaxID=85 RepID=Q0C223_HYPNA|nr:MULTISPECIES: diguanylate cyclase [Hyphomonas]ABI75394.1 putative diguanylate cyclase/response regulator [Hyphomonas neptunium ATCC 15444]KCZ93065.1 diguanylate cyclase [Hyphomonas hirschiana VP5]
MTRATILVVDDEISNIEIINAILEDQYEVCFAISGAQALETMRELQPDLVLLDVLMPEMDGFEVCKRIKNDPDLVDIPVIFTTGLGDTADEMRGLSLGAIDYVTKPIQPAILRARVTNHMELKSLRDQLANLAVTDALTGLKNRRYLERTLRAECARLARDEAWLSVIMLDIDFFKQFNDTYGHPAGDRCIAMIAATLKRVVKRASDTPARYGGEEFACILPDLGPAEAEIVAQEIRRQVHALNIPHIRSQAEPYVTVSIGVASARCHSSIEPGTWITFADQELYRSKAAGRDRVSVIEFSGDASGMETGTHG